MRRTVIWGLCGGGLAGVAGLSAVETYARRVYGLGDPPLLTPHPTIEYHHTGPARHRRLGNDIRFNAHGMRSDEFPARRTDPHEFRVMVLGDSVVHGGQQTDHADLATTILRTRMVERSGRPTVVGNVSAGSWGPPNLLAYVREFGLFDADVVVIVLNAHDLGDVPSGQPFAGTPEQPIRRPPLALWEAGRRLTRRTSNVPPKPSAGAREASLASLGTLLLEIHAADATPLIVLHPLRTDLDTGETNPALRRFAAVASSMGVDVLDLTAAYRSAHTLSRPPDAPLFRDDIHPGEAGHRLMADALADRLLRRLEGESSGRGVADDLP